jgi:hypothetical protein
MFSGYQKHRQGLMWPLRCPDVWVGPLSFWIDGGISISSPKQGPAEGTGDPDCLDNLISSREISQWAEWRAWFFQPGRWAAPFR